MQFLIIKLVLSDKKRFFAFAALRFRMTGNEGSEILNCFNFLPLEFRVCLGFRLLNLGFNNLCLSVVIILHPFRCADP